MSEEDRKRQLYSRQEYVVGADTQKRYELTDVLVVGACGLGAEMVKNLALSGVRSVHVLDASIVETAHLGTNFFLRETDIGRVRGAVVAMEASELNRFVDVRYVEGDVVQAMKGMSAVVFVNYPTTQLSEYNLAARRQGIKFVSVESRGIASAVFVDGGDVFEIADPDGEANVMCAVSEITADGIVKVHDDRNHECEVGSMVYFTGIVSPARLNSVLQNNDASTSTTGAQRHLFTVADVISPHVLRLASWKETCAGETVDTGTSTYLHTTKTARTISFRNLQESVYQPQFMTVFEGEPKMGASPTLHAVFRAVHQTGNAPQTTDEVEEVLRLVLDIYHDADKDTARQVLMSFRGDLNPLSCFMGGIAAQEVLKLCSGKFTPIHQWLYYDVRELLTARGGATFTMPSQLEISSSRYGGQRALWGAAFQDYLQQQRVCIVGAGALGCELIKNVALMGVGASSIVDMDHVEVSNLSRQFLFRDHHVGLPKSTTAAEAARAINPHFRVEAFAEHMGSETEHLFNEVFWDAHAVVLNAVDNRASRVYVDQRCLFYKKPLLESGTFGTKCNVQCIIPFVTESYSNSSDPPEKSIPLCTLKNFPNAIEHTIQWARDQFELLFVRIPTDVNSYLDDPDAFISSLQRDPASSASAQQYVNDALQNWPRSASDCVRRARYLYQDYFHDSLLHLLYNLPLDKQGEDGKPFWKGAKKPPTPQQFACGNEKDQSFVYYCALLLANVYGVAEFNLTPIDAARLAAEVPVPEYLNRTESASVPLEAALSRTEDFDGLRARPETLETDSATNHHIDFIAATSNLRATAYGIPNADVHHTRRIAGRITPAMVTTAAVATGLVGIEMLKYFLLQFRSGTKSDSPAHTPSLDEVNMQISLFRNAFVNIALPFVAFSDPIMAQGNTYRLPSGRSIRWSVWDRIDINEGRDISIKELVSILESRYEMEIFIIALMSGKMIYSQFGGKAHDRDKPVAAIAEGKGEVLKEGEDYLNLVATGSIGEEDAEIPVVRYKFKGFC